jgi:hypothetical protein
LTDGKAYLDFVFSTFTPELFAAYVREIDNAFMDLKENGSKKDIEAVSEDGTLWWTPESGQCLMVAVQYSGSQQWERSEFGVVRN